MPRRYVAVCGASEATPSQLEAAREVGKLLARSGAVILNGGYGGVTSNVRAIIGVVLSSLAIAVWGGILVFALIANLMR